MNWFGWKKEPKPLVKAAGSSLANGPKPLIAQKRGAIDDAVLQLNLDFARSTDAWNKGNSGTRWDGRVIHNDHMSPEIEATSLGVLLAMQKMIVEELRPTKPIYPDGYALVRWLPEDYQDAHADAEDPSGKQHPFWWRRYAAILYINRDFEGGEIGFPNQKLLIKPEPNLMVTFPSTLEYLHEVRKITKGIRYTLAAFWTDEPDRTIYPEAFRKG